VSSDPELERLLRDVRETLPGPTPEASRRARRAALAAIRPRRRRMKAAVLIAVALVVAVGAGSVLGALLAPRGSAAEGPMEFGFVPAPGWYALQAAPPATPGLSLVAMAANVPFSPDDSVKGLAEPSALPYSTLRTLPADGIVMVATLTALDLQTSGLAKYLSHFPLRVEDASPYVDFGVEVRPEKPLGQYQLRAAHHGWNVDVTVYFGTSAPSSTLRAQAQRQLDGVVVPEAPDTASARVTPKRATAAEASALAVVDRTFVCTVSYGEFTVVVSPRSTSEVKGVRTTSSGHARVTWGSDAYPLGDLVVVARPGLRNYITRFPGAVYASVRRCAASRTSVPLTHAGLPGPASVVRSDSECRAGGKVLVRVRAVLESPAPWRRLTGPVGSAYNGVKGHVVEAQLAVRDARTGKPLAFATLDRSEATRHWSAPWPRCV